MNIPVTWKGRTKHWVRQTGIEKYTNLWGTYIFHVRSFVRQHQRQSPRTETNHHSASMVRDGIRACHVAHIIALKYIYFTN